MKLTVVLLLAAFCLGETANAQSTQKQVDQTKGKFWRRFGSIDISLTNSHTAMPFGRFARLFTDEFHPGVELSTTIVWNPTKRYDWIQTVKLGYSYHQFLQHSATIYTEGGMRYKFPAGFAATGKIGFGYVFAIEDTRVFVLDEQGKYVGRDELGRSNLAGTFTIELSKTVGKKGTKLFFDYQQRLQLGFIESYVPMLPINMAGIGVALPLHKH